MTLWLLIPLISACTKGEALGNGDGIWGRGHTRACFSPIAGIAVEYLRFMDFLDYIFAFVVVVVGVEGVRMLLEVKLWISRRKPIASATRCHRSSICMLMIRGIRWY
jgi:hypothetical protein